NLASEYHPATSADAEKKFDEESIHLCDHTSELDQRFALGVVELNGALYAVRGFDGNNYLEMSIWLAYLGGMETYLNLGGKYEGHLFLCFHWMSNFTHSPCCADYG
ncbi:hypothetical protein GIB67_016640, partial [Kingdonia uniflora]